MIRLGKVQRTFAAGDRVLCDALVEGELERELILVYPLHLRMRVAEGTRVLVLRLDGNDVQLLALPIEFAGATDELVIHPAGGSKVQVGTLGGSFAQLATLADLKAHANWDAAHVHPGPGGNTGAPLEPPPEPAGTDTAEGE